MRGTGFFVATVLLAATAAGCLGPGGGDGDEREARPLSSVAVYEYRFDGDDVIHPDHPYGWMVRVTNVVPVNVSVAMDVRGNDTVWGGVSDDGWTAGNASARELAPGESALFLLQHSGAYVEQVEYAVKVVTPVRGDVVESEWFARALVEASSDMPVRANDHVTTRTVGVWVNGTSFYTNIPGLNEDPGFPAGYDRDDFAGGALPVYVYDEDTAEQPAGSRDRCYFVTIAGYNDLLKSQAEGTSNVRFLKPEEAYTRPGAEGHWLYGDALVFLNQVVAHHGEVDELTALPQPMGECFDPANAVPVPIPGSL